MSYKTILLPAIEKASLEAAFATALPIAQAFTSRLLGYHVIDNPPSLQPAELQWHPRLLQEIEEQIESRTKALREGFHALCSAASLETVPFDAPLSAEAVTAAWRESPGHEASTLPRFARQADLVVMARSEEKQRNRLLAAAEDVLALSGRPLLMAPESGVGAVPNSILIAWNGSVEASRALSFALPFLERAQKVTIVSIGEPEGDRPSAEDMAGYLGRRGIAAASFTREENRSPIAEQLMAEAAAVKADILVMGGYSHARWRENVLGGLTRHLMEHSTLPIFVTH